MDSTRTNAVNQEIAQVSTVIQNFRWLRDTSAMNLHLSIIGRTPISQGRMRGRIGAAPLPASPDGAIYHVMTRFDEGRWSALVELAQSPAINAQCRPESLA
jgi:hypothetical protein